LINVYFEIILFSISKENIPFYYYYYFINYHYILSYFISLLEKKTARGGTLLKYSIFLIFLNLYRYQSVTYFTTTLDITCILNEGMGWRKEFCSPVKHVHGFSSTNFKDFVKHSGFFKNNISCIYVDKSYNSIDRVSLNLISYHITCLLPIHSPTGM
jgi:hypothetical protein